MIDEVKDILIYVGQSFYPTIEDFTKEAEKLGVCRRIHRFPESITPGVSRCFLAHEQKIVCPVCNGKRKYDKTTQKLERTECNNCNNFGVIKSPVVFGFFIIGGIEIILNDVRKIADFKEKVQELNIRAVDYQKAILEPSRGCGTRKLGGSYFFGDTDFDKLFEIAKVIGEDKVDLKGNLIVFRNPIPLPAHYGKGHLRGYKYFNIKETGNLVITEEIHKELVVKLYRS